MSRILVDTHAFLWLVSDNLRKGAALHAVQIAEELITNYNLQPSAQVA